MRLIATLRRSRSRVNDAERLAPGTSVLHRCVFPVSPGLPPKSPRCSTLRTRERAVLLAALCLFPYPLFEISSHPLFLIWRNAVNRRGPASTCVFLPRQADMTTAS